ncbi:MAG: hypothetical protein RJA36_1422 [Pseudomonadota bacterium]|jgi:hypothetical protein
MQNLKITTNGTKVTLEFDTSKPAQQAAKLSSTGKTRLLAGTGGASPVDVPGCPGLKVALNVMIPA